jgi:AraC family transcriptional regulator
MSKVDSIYQAVEFMEEHLTQAIAIGDAADAVSYSVYHFCRMFNEVVHHSPYDYLIRRRLSESVRDLTTTDRKIIDIGLDFQFNSPETYSRAFKRMFEMQPNQCRKRGTIDRRLLMAPLSLRHLQHRNEGDLLKPIFQEKDAFQVAGLMTLVSDDRRTIRQLWDLLAQELEVRTPDVSKANISIPEHYGIVAYPKDWEKCGFCYMAARESYSADVTSPSLAVKIIPPLKYAKFIHKGPYEDIRFTLDYVYQTWLPQSGQRLAYPVEIEYHKGGFGGSDPSEAEVEILIPVK